MNRYQVTVRAGEFTPWTTVIESDKPLRQGQVETRAMFVQPHRLTGQLVEFDHQLLEGEYASYK